MSDINTWVASQFVSTSDSSCIHQLFFSHVDTWTHQDPNFWALLLYDSLISNWLAYWRKDCMVFLTIKCVCGVATSKISPPILIWAAVPILTPPHCEWASLYSAQMQCFGHGQLHTQLWTWPSTFNGSSTHSLCVSFWFLNIIFMVNNAFSHD